MNLHPAFWLFVASLVICTVSFIVHVLLGSWLWEAVAGAIIALDVVMMKVLYDRAKAE